VTTKRFLGAFGISLGLVLTVGACGGQQFSDTQSGSPTTVPKTASPTARLLSALKTTTAARTARVSIAVTVSVHGSGNDGTVTEAGTGLIDLSGRRMTMKLTEHDPDNDVTTEIRVVNGILYTNSGAEWTRFPVGTAAGVEPEPTSYLDYLQGISDDVHVEGREVVRGAETTRYGATVDLARAVSRAVSAAQRVQLTQTLSVLGALKIPAKVWVDDQGRLRKVQENLDVGRAFRDAGLPAGADVRMSVTAELYDFGVAVDVTAPAGAIDAAVAAQYRATESDLRNALTAEKTIYTDNQTYSADTATLKTVEPSLGWGGKLRVVVAGSGTAPQDMVCLSEASKSGAVFAIADVSDGPFVGTYYGRHGCPSSPTAQNLAALGARW
jgi:hypothetical protein